MNGAYRLSNYSGNVFSAGSFGVIDVVVNASYARMNAVLTTSGLSYQYYTRLAWSSEWRDWQRIDNFGCSTPKALASLLGDVLDRGNIGDTNPDDIIVDGIWTNNGSNLLPTQYGTLIHKNCPKGNYSKIQIYLPSNGGIKTRRMTLLTSQWGNWT